MAGVRQFDEREALARALEVFAVRGYRATSMQHLAVGTGVQRGSLYHAYGGKEQIFLRVFGDYTQAFLTGAAQTLRQDDRHSALLSFFDHCIRSITAGTPSRGCLSTRTVIDAGSEIPQVETVVRTFLDDLEDTVHNGLAAIDDDDLAVDLRSAARLVVTTTRGLAVMERAHHEPDRLRDIAAALVTSLTGRSRSG
ncbi:TetR family transcriptional regulator [Streptomyces antimycoticus]|uniref:TetR family transcriptional regulator n=1 Tax=Streptomyces antimycoticus TaxID=68175 RepID=A0A499V4K4_9ACTN|nr:TetR/AcrR family transcriptional regulator [Streptomyces antimycoticus]BBJ43929.1 TetR family transcriptional regulator [Streptomyces antimycoticus]